MSADQFLDRTDAELAYREDQIHSLNEKLRQALAGEHEATERLKKTLITLHGTQEIADRQRIEIEQLTRQLEEAQKGK